MLDNKTGTLLTLVNWTNEERLDAIEVSIRLATKPSKVFSVTNQRPVPFDYVDKTLRLTTTLKAADFIMVMK